MRKILFLLSILTFLILIVFLTSLVSAGIIINKQPRELYSLGDFVETSFKVVATTNMNIGSSFSVNLICNGIENEIVRYPVGHLKIGEEENFNVLIPLVKEYLGKTSGTCVIKAILIDEYQLTNEFRVSDLINVRLLSEEREFEPRKDIIIEGEAIKEDGRAVSGAFVELKIVLDNSTITQIIDTVTNGYFFLNFSLPANTRAGQHSLNINVYELYNEERTNQGSIDFSILIKQIPTSLEVVFENQQVEPGTNLRVKGVLYDQTGQNIVSNISLIIKNNKNIVLQEAEKLTNEFLEFPIPYNEPPLEWIVAATSRGLTSESNFKILEKEEVKIDVVNKTLMITNIGNIPYNKTLLVQIGSESKEIKVFLEVDETKKYILSAPDGEYEVNILGDKGNLFTGSVVLAGRVIDVEEAKVIALKKALVWIPLIFILGISALLIFTRVRKKSFFGFIPKISSRKKSQPLQLGQFGEIRESLGNKAELSLSIKGEKQDVNVVCLRINNLWEIKSKGDVKETLKKIFEMAEENKAVVYESRDFLFFILAPLRTKTFKNEKDTINLSQKIKEILIHHNKLFKQKMDFGISLDYGAMVVKQEPDTKKFKFMSIGTLLTNSKKIAMVSGGEILLSEKINSKILEFARTMRQTKDNLVFYIIREMKDSEENKKFIRNFLKRIEEK